MARTFGCPCGKIPPRASGKPSSGETEHVPRIGHSDVQAEGTNDFAHDRPDDQVTSHLAPKRRLVVRPPFQKPLHPYHYGQGGRDQQQIIQMAMENTPTPWRMSA